jgi:TolB protein
MPQIFRSPFSSNRRTANAVVALLVAAGVSLVSVSLAGCGIFGSDDTTPPNPPSSLQATSGDARINLEWDEVQAEDLNGYNVYRSTSSIGDVSNLSPVNGDTPVSQASYTDEGVTNGTTYRYVVTALDDAGNESNPSDEVEKTPFSRPPDRP